MLFITTSYHKSQRGNKTYRANILLLHKCHFASPQQRTKQSLIAQSVP